VLFAVTILTRLPFTSRFLYSQDSVQFALALENYDVYLHQPHPPGYFLYVMAGKLLNYFIQDANVSFITISVIASALTVVAVYYLARAIFAEGTAWWAGMLAVTSPLLWFYGEVALSYIVAAFVNTWIALLCWDTKKIYLSAILLGIGAGIRQDLFMFLFPLWIFCLGRIGLRQLIIALIILSVTIGSWFVPMLISTGGAERYLAAVNKFWEFHYSQFPIWNPVAPSRRDIILTILGFASYGVGIGTVFIAFGCYALFRTGDWRLLGKDKLFFFSLWLLPAIIFHYFIFLHPYNHAYGVFFLPALFIILPPAVEYVLVAVQKVSGFRNLPVYPVISGTLVVLVVINVAAFLLANFSYSAKSIREHDRNLSIMLDGIKKKFRTDETIVLDVRSSIFYGYRHVQYYLPGYKVFLADVRVNNRGQTSGVTSAMNGQTFISEAIHIAPTTRYIVYLMDPSDEEYKTELQRQGLHQLQLRDALSLYYRDLKSDR